MKIRHLQTRFILAGILLVMTTVVSGIWSAWTFAHLSEVAGRTIQKSQLTTDLSAVLADALEREDDELLLAMSGDRAQAQKKLAAERMRFAQAYERLKESLDEPDEVQAAAQLAKYAAQYRAAGDALLSTVAPQDAFRWYYQNVNPALRKAVAACAEIRESNFRAMQLAGIRAHAGG